MTLRVACVGAGYFSQFHIDSWRRIPHVELVGVCDQVREKAEATGAPAFTNLATMLDAVQPDIVDLILPPVRHAEAIRTAIAHQNLKAIICQKPFCENLAEAEDMVALAQEANVPLIVHENFRFQPWYRRAKEVLDQGSLGDLYQVTFRLRPGDGQGADAYLARQPYFQKMKRFLIHETGVHWIDTFRYLLGPPHAVYADLRRVNPVIAGEDAGFVVLDHAAGVRAVFDGNRNVDHAADNPRRTMGEATFEGSGGVLTLRGDGSLGLRKHGAQSETVILPPDAHEGFGGDCTHALQLHVVSGLMSGQPLENLAADYLQVIRIEEAVYRSAETGQKVKV
ncbi:Gfo/Idh/MocA family oxidoreductase [Cognatiyoonia sp. IB215446]|uniref:Gfo/Idh/MocA family protein n=1 Tax=Cognatiyoonia sp. IB215446 TaxID=3097355 RepID=UPI002A149E5C|nr:Gfo/Idh/MocA family oxidoreductase [Cognatiyoonia sp. IB215446]MDX8350585.1 Gfo/Idh/MocA family oxidoreductase [Cognatiyoonia sp. IB215446]